MGTEGRFTLSLVTPRFQPHPSRADDLYPGASNIPTLSCPAPLRALPQGGQASRVAPAEYRFVPRRPDFHWDVVPVNLCPSPPDTSGQQRRPRRRERPPRQV